MGRPQEAGQRENVALERLAIWTIPKQETEGLRVKYSASGCKGWGFERFPETASVAAATVSRVITGVVQGCLPAPRPSFPRNPGP